jgi:hypothetical protein
MNETNTDITGKKLKSQKRGIWKRLKAWFSRSWKRIQPGAGVRKGAAVGIATLVIILAVTEGYFLCPGFKGIFNSLSGVLIALIIVAIIGVLVLLAFKLLNLLPRFLNVSGLVILAVYIICLRMLRFPFFFSLLVGLGAAFLGGAVAALFSQSFKKAVIGKKIFVFFVIAVTVALTVYVIYWFADRGTDKHLVEKRENPVQVQLLDAANPALPGPFEVLYVTYGSGADKHRPEFGEEVGIKTEPVDATPFVKGNKGWKMKLRKWYWSFDFKEFPVNGRVWYPAGEGPFPLVLCVHGNHKMEEFSDPGYAYLGRHLASRGFIFVSVDENFFNGSWISNLKKENDGRAWMLLKHFCVWREWNKTEGHPFFGKVDMDNLGIIGHSRGGEAAGHAGCFNRLTHYPDDATVAFDFNFNLKAIVAIAPCDGQYKPAGKPTPLENVNYLTLQGAHDADVSSFAGARQYNRVKFTDGRYWFKASLYSYRSNHGQFNTVWGDSDWGKPSGVLLNKKALLTGEDQRRLGKVYMTAFLEAILQGKEVYIPLFRDFRLASNWLPDDIYVNRFEDSTFLSVCNFEEDVEVMTASLEAAEIYEENIALWREADLGFRKSGTKANNVVFLGWRSGPEEKTEEEGAAYSIEIPYESGQNLGLTRDSILVFNLAAADEKLPEPDDEEESEEKKEEKKAETEKPEKKREEKDKKDGKKKDKDEEDEKELLDLSIELVTTEDVHVKIPLSQFRTIPPILKSRFTKFKKESKMYGKAYEPTLQLFELPLKRFIEENPEFNPALLKTIRFVFDLCQEGVIILDNIGFAQPNSGLKE